MFRPFVIVIAAAFLVQPAFAGDDKGRIVMTGTAGISAVPDEAVVSAGVQTKGDTAREALSDNTGRMKQVFAALSDLGIDPRDISTSSFNISPHWEHGSSGSRQRGYQVSNQVTVRLRNVNAVGEVLDTLVTAGANQAGGVRFIVKNRDSLLDSARVEAVSKAKARAVLYAQAAGVRLGDVIRITEGGTQGGPQPVFEARAASFQAVPVSAGEQDLSVSVTVTWALKQ